MSGQITVIITRCAAWGSYLTSCHRKILFKNIRLWTSTEGKACRLPDSREEQPLLLSPKDSKIRSVAVESYADVEVGAHNGGPVVRKASGFAGFRYPAIITSVTTASCMSYLNCRVSPLIPVQGYLLALFWNRTLLFTVAPDREVTIGIATGGVESVNGGHWNKCQPCHAPDRVSRCMWIGAGLCAASAPDTSMP